MLAASSSNPKLVYMVPYESQALIDAEGQPPQDLKGRDLAGMTLGVVAQGALARQVAGRTWLYAAELRALFGLVLGSGEYPLSWTVLRRAIDDAIKAR
jgi:hypothetical protein